MAEYIGWNLCVFVFVFVCLFVPPCIFWSSSPFLLENVQAKAVKSSSIFLELDAPPPFLKNVQTQAEKFLKKFWIR